MIFKGDQPTTVHYTTAGTIHMQHNNYCKS